MPSTGCLRRATSAHPPPLKYNDGPAYDDANVDFLADQMVLVSGIGGEASNLIFTAPQTGLYALTTSFRGDQYGIGVAVDVEANGSSLFESTVSGEGVVVTDSTAINLTAGQEVVWGIEPDGGLQNTGISADMTLLPSPTPEPDVGAARYRARATAGQKGTWRGTATAHGELDQNSGDAGPQWSEVPL